MKKINNLETFCYILFSMKLDGVSNIFIIHFVSKSRKLWKKELEFLDSKSSFDTTWVLQTGFELLFIWLTVFVSFCHLWDICHVVHWASQTLTGCFCHIDRDHLVIAIISKRFNSKCILPGTSGRPQILQWLRWTKWNLCEIFFLSEIKSSKLH